MATIFWKLGQVEDTTQMAQAQARVMDKEAHLLLMERKDEQLRIADLALGDCRLKLELAKQSKEEAEKVVMVYRVVLAVVTVLGLVGWAV